MNFATLKGLTIPEGTVTQVTDASGRVLWKKAPSGATITIIGDGGNYANVVIDGVTYNTAAEVVVPIGTVITCVTQNGRTGGPRVLYNCEIVSVGINTQYEYNAVNDVTIALGAYDPSGLGQAVGGHISIVDENAPQYATVTITRPAMHPSAPYVSVSGRAYRVPAIVHAPIGSTVDCYPTSGTVFVNGETVATTTYSYTLESDVNIDLKFSMPGGSPVGDIYITEL